LLFPWDQSQNFGLRQVASAYQFSFRRVVIHMSPYRQAQASPHSGQFRLEEDMRSRETFQHILVAVAPQNIQALDHEARTASALAVTYPENEGAFRAIESAALRQIFCIVVHEKWTGDTGVAVGSGENRFVSVASSVVYEDQERGFRQWATKEHVEFRVSKGTTVSNSPPKSSRLSGVLNWRLNSDRKDRLQVLPLRQHDIRWRSRFFLRWDCCSSPD
jgi:hypothetical protein